MKGKLVFSLAAFALIQNVSAVNLNKWVLADEDYDYNGPMRVQKNYTSEKTENDVNDNDVLHDDAKRIAKIDAAGKKAH